MRGEVAFLYAFDAANEIITSRVHEILSTRPFPFEIRMDRTLPKDMPLYKPLAIEPPPLEAYTVFCVTDLGGAKDANAWLVERRRAVAGLLTETAAEKLSEPQVNEVLRIQRSFENTDLVVIDWDAALVVDLTGYVDDVLYALELANLQLEEFRTMDQRLDKYLDRAYDDLERRRMPLLDAASKMSRHLGRSRVDVAKLTDEVTHITKFLGDWYLARVYLGARDRF